MFVQEKKKDPTQITVPLKLVDQTNSMWSSAYSQSINCKCIIIKMVARTQSHAQT